MRLAQGRVATEADMPNQSFPKSHRWPRERWRSAACVLRLVRFAPSVHGLGDYGFLPIAIGMAREKGVSAYLSEGLNRSAYTDWMPHASIGS